MWDTIRAVLREKFIPLYAYIRKFKRCKKQ